MSGGRVLVTRASHQAGPLIEALRLAGFVPVAQPTIDIEIDLVRVPLCEWVVVTSANGVQALGGQSLGPARLAVVGEATAEAARSAGYRVSFTPSRATGETLVDEFGAGSASVVVVQGNLAAPTVVDGLRANGWQVSQLVGYRTSVGSAAPLAEADVITFTSPSTVDGFVAAFGVEAVTLPVVTIGPVTTAACRRHAIAVAAQAEPHSVSGLIAALKGLSG